MFEHNIRRLNHNKALGEMIQAEEQKQQDAYLASLQESRDAGYQPGGRCKTKAQLGAEFLQNKALVEQNIKALLIGSMIKATGLVEGAENYSDKQVFDEAMEFLTMRNLVDADMMITAKNASSANATGLSPQGVLNKATAAIMQASKSGFSDPTVLRELATATNITAIDAILVTDHFGEDGHKAHADEPYRLALHSEIVDNVKKHVATEMAAARTLQEHGSLALEESAVPVDDSPAARIKAAMRSSKAKRLNSLGKYTSLLAEMYAANRIDAEKSDYLPESAQELSSACMAESVFQLTALQTFRVLGLVDGDNKDIREKISTYRP